jgi:uncharacterized protein (DUF169 family)
MSTKNYNWKEINERLNNAVKPKSSALALKYFKNQEDADKVPEVKNFGRLGVVCRAFAKVIKKHETICFNASNNGFDYCLICNGILPITERWEKGEALQVSPTHWFNTPESAKAHADYQKKGVPEGGNNILVISPIETGNIADPDVIILSLQPGAAFILLAGLLNQDFQEISFPFVGESNCTDTWGYTYNTGKPGLTLGCKGDRLAGELKDDEIRISLTPDDLIKALDGFDVLQNNGINYPTYTFPGYVPA